MMALVVFVVAMLVMAAWLGWLNWAGDDRAIWLRQPIAGEVSMKFATALGFAISSTALIFIRWRWVVRAVAVVLSLWSAIHLIEYGVGDLGVDHLFVSDADGTGTPGRMAPHTALGFVVFAVSLWCLTVRRWAVLRWASYASLALVLLGCFGVVGYAASMPLLHGGSGWASMAIHTAILFVVLGFGELSLVVEIGSRLGIR